MLRKLGVNMSIIRVVKSNKQKIKLKKDNYFNKN